MGLFAKLSICGGRQISRDDDRRQLTNALDDEEIEGAQGNGDDVEVAKMSLSEKMKTYFSSGERSKTKMNTNTEIATNQFKVDINANRLTIHYEGKQMVYTSDTDIKQLQSNPTFGNEGFEQIDLISIKSDGTFKNGKYEETKGLSLEDIGITDVKDDSAPPKAVQSENIIRKVVQESDNREKEENRNESNGLKGAAHTLDEFTGKGESQKFMNASVQTGAAENFLKEMEIPELQINGSLFEDANQCRMNEFEVFGEMESCIKEL